VSYPRKLRWYEWLAVPFWVAVGIPIIALYLLVPRNPTFDYRTGYQYRPPSRG
jgi:hypothetical protein